MTIKKLNLVPRLIDPQNYHLYIYIGRGYIYMLESLRPFFLKKNPSIDRNVGTRVKKDFRMPFT